MAENGTYNGQKRVGAEQSSYYREHPVDFGKKRKKVGVWPIRYGQQHSLPLLFSGTPVFGQKTPEDPVFDHCS